MGGGKCPQVRDNVHCKTFYIVKHNYEQLCHHGGLNKNEKNVSPSAGTASLETH